MAEFRIKIAGHTAQIHSLFASTRDYCRNYLTEEEPRLHISITQADLAFEQAALDEEALEEGLKRRKFSEPFLERTAIQRKLADFLLTRNILLLHGSAVAVDGRGYLFTAACGTGKSTHTRLWREVFGPRATMVNDDKPFVLIHDGSATLFGAPWSGKHGLDTNTAVPLQGICILRRGSENRISRMSPEQALPMLLHQSHQSSDPSTHALVNQLAAAIPLWQMECTRDPEAAVISHSAMSGTGVCRSLSQEAPVCTENV